MTNSHKTYIYTHVILLLIYVNRTSNCSVYFELKVGKKEKTSSIFVCLLFHWIYEREKRSLVSEINVTIIFQSSVTLLHDSLKLTTSLPDSMTGKILVTWLATSLLLFLPKNKKRFPTPSILKNFRTLLSWSPNYVNW